MGAYRKLHFRKMFIECLFIHAVDISTCIHSNNCMVFVGSLGVVGCGKFEMLPPILPLLASIWLTSLNIFTLGGLGCLFMAVLAFCILSWTLLSQLVVWFSTSHVLSLHPWGFSRLMIRIRSPCAPELFCP